MALDAETRALLRTIGANVARLRRARGLTQAQLAEALECEPTYVQKIEYGTSAPSLQMLARLGKRLQVPVGALFRAAKPVPSKPGRPKGRRGAT